jgi:hypothetical protein
VPNLNPKVSSASAVCILINEDSSNVITRMAASFGILELLMNEDLLKDGDPSIVLFISLPP